MTAMLSPAELTALSQRLAANADRLIALHNQKLHATAKRQPKPQPKNPGERRGRPPKRVQNPFAEHVGPNTEYGRYPAFALDIIEGIARLDWHDRKEGSLETSKPLSVRTLMDLLASVDEVTTTTVMELRDVNLRQAQRYVKAMELAMPFLIKARPSKLIFAMDQPEDRVINAAYSKRLREIRTELLTELPPPTPEELAKLRRALGEDAFDLDRFIYAAYSKELQEAA